MQIFRLIRRGADAIVGTIEWINNAAYAVNSMLSNLVGCLFNGGILSIFSNLFNRKD